MSQKSRIHTFFEKILDDLTILGEYSPETTIGFAYQAALSRRLAPLIYVTCLAPAGIWVYNPCYGDEQWGGSEF